MKKKYLKTTSVLLCAALLIAGGGTAVRAKNADKDHKETKKQETRSKKDIKEKFENGDTYYVFSDASGNAEKVMVSDGDEGFVEDSSKKMEENIPLNIKVSYELDGKKSNPEDLKGKSGHMKIHFEYENNQYEKRQINGKEEMIYVPYAVMTGLMLDNKIFKNVEITNGKMLDDGERTSIMCFALPGMQHNLNLDKEKLELPETVDISADVKNFEMAETMTVVTNEIFNDIKDQGTNQYDELNGSLDQLKNAMGQLMDGSSKLYGGLDLLLDKSGDLKSGVKQLTDGTSALASGASDLDKGVSQLQSGAGELSKGLSTLTSNNKMLTDGAAQTFQAILKTANEQIAAAGLEVPQLTIKNYAGVLNNVIASLDKNAVYEKALQQVKAAVEAQRPVIEKAVTDVVRTQVRQQVKQAVLQQVGASDVPDEALDPKIVAMIEKKTDETMQSEQIKEQIKTNTELKVQQIISEKMASEEVQSKLAAASEGAKKLIEVKALLDNYNSFYLGIITYTDGVASAADGAKQLNNGICSLKSGADRLQSGASQLNEGVGQLAKQTPELINGVTELRNGSMTLSDGLKQFNEEGIEKITKAAKDDVGVLIERIKTTVEVSKNYRPFSEDEGIRTIPARFIYRTESVEKQSKITK